jgi:glycosyltransferase involved in cell wall biosynthesis
MKTEEPIQVSICCAYFNRTDVIRESIDSLLNQQHDNFEVIVINDGSTDPNVKKILDNYSHINLTVVHQENTGFVKAIKNAINLSKGKYIAIHGAGDISFPNRIKRQSQFLDQNNQSGAVSCYFENTVFGGTNHGNTTISQPTNLILNASNFTGKINPYSHGEVMFRKSTYEQVGGYREFFKFAQDRDLWLRMIEVCEMNIYPEVLYQRREFTSDGISTNREKLILQKYLSTFARQCFKDREKSGTDLLQKHGHIGVLFRDKSKILATFCAFQAIESLSQDKLEDASKFIRVSLDEKISFYGMIFNLVIKVSHIRLFKWVFQKLIKLHPRANKWNRK